MLHPPEGRIFYSRACGKWFFLKYSTPDKFYFMRRKLHQQSVNATTLSSSPSSNIERQSLPLASLGLGQSAPQQNNAGSIPAGDTKFVRDWCGT